jgi:hypothetical protein
MRAVDKLKVRWGHVAAFLLAPLAPGLLAVITSAFHNISEGVWVLKLSAMATYPAMTVLGVPAHLFLMKKGWTRGWVYTLTGLIIGLVVGIMVTALTQGIPWGLLCLVGVFGALTGFAAWAIARPDRNPD